MIANRAKYSCELSLFAAVACACLAAPLSADPRPPAKHAIVEAFGFQQRELQSGSVQVIYYLKDCRDSGQARLFVYLQGSDPGPQFLWRNASGVPRPLTAIPSDHEQLGEHDCYVVVEKAGMEGVFEEPILTIPQSYHDANSLDDRVARASAVIDHLQSVRSFDQIVVYGHSEGAPVAAKLATQNEHVTHLGFWAGSVLGDFYDFTIQARTLVHSGEETAYEAQRSINEAISHFASEVVADPNSTRVDDFGYTNLRWMSFSEPPLYHLLAIDIPIFMQVATDDESAPIDSTYIVPLEFARLGKSNLTYRVCYGCDHGFGVTSNTGEQLRKWPEIFADMLGWLDATTE